MTKYRKATYPKEEEALQATFVGIQKRVLPMAVLFSVPNEAARTRWGQFEITGALKGASDLVMLYKGQHFFIEMKKEKGGIYSKAQIAFGGNVVLNGGQYVRLHTINDAMVFLRALEPAIMDHKEFIEHSVSLLTRMLAMRKAKDPTFLKFIPCECIKTFP